MEKWTVDLDIEEARWNVVVDLDLDTRRYTCMDGDTHVTPYSIILTSTRIIRRDRVL